jgi:hypothetical protein
LVFSAAAVVVVGGVVASGVAIGWASTQSPATRRLLSAQQGNPEAKDTSIFAEGGSAQQQTSPAPTTGAQPNAAVARSTLQPGDTLTAGQQLTSDNGRFQVVMQTDGNVVELDAANKVIWSTQTGSNDGAKLIFQQDGNLVVHSATGKTALWASGTAASRAAAKLLLQDDGNLVLYHASGKALWGSMQDNTILFTGQVLRAGQSRISVDKRYTVHQQEDGNLVVLRNATRTVLWSSQTGAHPGAYTVLAGSLVTFDRNGKQLFTTGPTSFDNNTVVMQSDGNLVIVRPDNSPVWGSNSHGVSLVVPGQTLTPGQWRISTDGRYRLDMQTDGNLVLYDEQQNHKPLFESRTGNNPGAFARLQTDGNFVILTPSGRVLFHTATGGQPVKHLAVQSDGNLVLVSMSGQPIWWSRR